MIETARHNRSIGKHAYLVAQGITESLFTDTLFTLAVRPLEHAVILKIYVIGHTIQNHLKTLLSQCKSELIISSADTEYLLHMIPEKTLKQLARKVNLYLVVKEDKDAEGVPVPCMTLDSVRIPKTLRDVQPTPFHKQNSKFLLISDRTSMLSIDTVEGNLQGMVFFTDRNFFISLMAENLISYLKPLPQIRK